MYQGIKKCSQCGLIGYLKAEFYILHQEKIINKKGRLKINFWGLFLEKTLENIQNM